MDIKILIITQGITPIVKALLSSHHEIVGIAEDAPRNAPRKRWRIYDAVKLILHTESLLTLCKSRGIPYFYHQDGNQEIFESWVRSKKPDIIVVYLMSRLLKEEIFSIPKYGTINLHPSLLPSYRGPNPIFWMYYNMEKKGGITIHYVDKGEDTGDIIYQESYDISPGSSGPDLQSEVVSTIGVPLLIKAIKAIEEGYAPRIPQPEGSPTLRARNILPDEQKNIIDWKNWDIKRIWHLMRGYANSMDLIEPPRGIYAGQRWTVEGYTKCDTSKYSKGIVLKNSDGYYIAGSNGLIQLSINFKLKRTLGYVLNRIMR
jgi:methionyl-tRNA formyltransferase